MGSRPSASEMLLCLHATMLILSGTRALVCTTGFLVEVKDRSEFPLTWTADIKNTCEPGEGCQDTIILLTSGDKVALILSKGCTEAQTQEPLTTQNSGPPGVIIVSYTHVCYSDLCNSLSDTQHLWNPFEFTDAPPPENLQCPICVSLYSCPSDAPLVTCPSGTDHCYSGTIQLSGGGLSHSLGVQGCMPPDAYQLLNGTQTIGPIILRENYDDEESKGTKALICASGFLLAIRDRSEFPVSWTANYNATCDPGENCQDTLILLENGNKVTVILSKGCTGAETMEPLDSSHRWTAGMTISSYTHICPSDLCNDLNTTDPLWIFSEPVDYPEPGDLQCPICVSLHSCPSNAPLVTCPGGTDHCYNGNIWLLGGGFSHSLKIQGCVPQDNCQLLNGTQEIGPIALMESCTGPVTCYKQDNLYLEPNLSEKPQNLSTDSTMTCRKGELCHETVLMVESGSQSILLVTKGCMTPGSSASSTIKIGPPGVTIFSYTRVCSSNLCNNIDSTASILMPSPPAPPAPGGLQCPTCVSLRSCWSESPSFCPEGTTHCYKGTFSVQGGNISVPLAIQGCATVSCGLLKGIQTIGPITMTENC